MPFYDWPIRSILWFSSAIFPIYYAGVIDKNTIYFADTKLKTLPTFCDRLRFWWRSFLLCFRNRRFGRERPSWSFSSWWDLFRIGLYWFELQTITRLVLYFGELHCQASLVFYNRLPDVVIQSKTARMPWVNGYARTVIGWNCRWRCLTTHWRTPKKLPATVGLSSVGAASPASSLPAPVGWQWCR